MPSATPQQSALRIGVDVGGTFTDLVCFDEASGELRVVKLPSTPPEFHLAVIEAVGRVRLPDRPMQIVHGSTVATNALLQRAGEPVAFVTTEGFRDMLLIGRQNRPRLYALRVERPPPLTSSENCFTVRERIGPAGEVIESLSEAEVDALVQQILSRGLRHVAVCLLFSFVNPIHERLIGRRCADAGLTVNLSSDILPEFREYERASTTVINASLRPIIERYLEALERGLREGSGFRVQGSEEGSEFRGQRSGGEGKPASSSLNPEPRTLNPSLRIMHSAGGTLTPGEASASAARLVLSGPAGGVMGAAFVAEAAGLRDLITYDMGGTSTDVSVILDGRPQWTTSNPVDGLPIGLSTLDIHTVGAGGGSISYLDAGGALRVGPRSAGAAPGPACYGRGGIDPTVTDANLVLGRIVPEWFAGGTMQLHPDLARRAIEPLAKAMNKSVEQTALGILRVVENNMGHAIRAVTSRRGLDPRDFALLSFGGAGGLHACALADGLEIPRVLVPPYCGVLSALGMVVAPPIADASKTVVHLGEQLDDARLAAEFGLVSGQTMQAIPYDQTAAVEAFADVRFSGQSHEVKVRLERPSLAHVRERFLVAYRELYGQVPESRPVEIVTIRVRRVGTTPQVRLPPVSVDRERRPSRAELVDADAVRKDVPVLTRSDPALSGRVRGPAILADPEATAFIPSQWSATVLADGSSLLERAEV